MLLPSSKRWVHSAFVLPLLMVMFVVLIAFLAFAVDYGYVALARSELRAAIDAANLAGASGLTTSPAEARKRAKDIAASNKVAGQPLVLQDSDIELGTWDSVNSSFVVLSAANESKANAMRITGRRTKARGNPIDLVFAKLLGFTSTDMTRSGVAGFGAGTDVVIIQDITGSFAEELTQAKEGDQALLDALYMGGTGKSYVGIAAHTGWGKTIAPLQSIYTDYSALTTSISSLKLCGSSGMPVCSGTDIAAGLEEGIKIFSDSTYLSKANGVRAIVLVSDGEPNVDSDGEHPGYTNDQLLTLAQQRADEAWAKGIHVYVVFYNRENDASAFAKVSTIPRGKGDCVNVPNAGDLPAALGEITKRFPTMLLQ